MVELDACEPQYDCFLAESASICSTEICCQRFANGLVFIHLIYLAALTFVTSELAWA
jgi:hypothetical protein